MKFGKWSPDQPDYGHDGLVTCRNVYASDGGYRPFKGFSAATGALPAAWVGSGAFENNGTSMMVGATAAGLYSHSGGVWTSEYVVATSQRWFFNQFGDLVIGTHGGAPVKYTLSTGAGGLLAGSPPSASFSAVCKGFLGLAGDASDAATFKWSGLEDPEGWTVGVNQSDAQTIPDGGPITGLAGGEYWVIFQRSAITLGEYIGLPFIFAFRKISDEVGCVHHGSIARVGDRIFFLSEQGFKVLRAGEVASIGEPDETGQGGVDETFLNTYTTSEIEGGISAAIDQTKKLVVWSMPGRLWVYHWPSGKWSDVVDNTLAGVSYGMTASATLEGVGVIFPAIEDVTPNLDDAYWRGGERMLLYAKTDFTLYTASGDNLDYTIKTAKMEAAPGQDVHIREVMPITDATALTVNADMSATLVAAPTRTTSSDLRSNGVISIRPTAGKFAQLEFNGSTGTYLQGFTMKGTPGGSM